MLTAFHLSFMRFALAISANTDHPFVQAGIVLCSLMAILAIWLRTRRFDDGYFWLHSSAESRPQNIEVNRAAFILGPFRNAFGLSKSGYQYVASSIARLSSMILEAAVRWRVAKIIILALNRQTLAPSTAQRPRFKSGETLVPFGADSNSTPAVAVEGMAARIRATLAHRHPHMIKRVRIDWPLGASLASQISPVASLRTKRTPRNQILPHAKCQPLSASLAAFVHNRIIQYREAA